MKAARPRFTPAVTPRDWPIETIDGVPPTTVNPPPAIAARLTSELQKAVRDPEVAKNLNAAGMPVVGSTGEQFAARIREDIEGWTPIIKAGKITGD